VDRLKPGRRTLAAVAVVLVLVAMASDFLIAGFWTAHPMLTAMLSALLVVLLSVAVIEVVLAGRAERRWRLLAQSALIELAEEAHATWSTLAEGLGVPERADQPPDQVKALLASPQQARPVRRFVEKWLGDSAHQKRMHELLQTHLATGRQTLASWAVVLTGSERYAGIFDEHVEMYSRVGGLRSFLDSGFRHSDPRRQRARSSRHFGSPGGEEDDVWFVDNLIGTISIAADLEDRTWNLALRVAPEEWWDRRTADLAAPSHSSG
jgi:hypothetical protein